jgi:hypothetical protein
MFVDMKKSTEFTEKWVQKIISEDSSLLGFGEIKLIQSERKQIRAGRLDLLFQDAEDATRYVVEIQLGTVDESHIIRTLEYWDFEKRQHPKYDHVAVIIAEDITTRFLNVISLLNKSVPLIAMQMKAVQIKDSTSLVFTKVLDLTDWTSDDDDDAEKEETNRCYWETTQGTKETVAMADKLLEIIQTFDPGLELKYNKFYIGLGKNGMPNNYVIFRPKKNSIRVELRLPQDSVTEQKIEAAGLDMLDYDRRWKRYRIRLEKGEIEKHATILKSLLEDAFRNK